VTISDRTVAIVGTCNIGGILAADFAVGGQDFLLAGRDQEAEGDERDRTFWEFLAEDNFHRMYTDRRNSQTA
jgi:hypothetical protein